ncbi:membrane protein [Reticulibacter mediterranei]|uniref:Membrane protein n=1 Tax=Reticulibacter mediterranei TaxID=2778369 RepID=A0A8J3N886_9CHLR|nr:DMT family transporter [Reticulibacter mediterranei]GHO97997.1 membrane protein [Reticulibacter mediterranei]
MFLQKSSVRGFLLITIASVFWGTVGIANQAIYAHSAANAFSLAFWRLAIAAPLFVLASWLLTGRLRFQVRPRDLIVMLLMGVLQALYQASYSAAIPYAGVTVSTLIALCAAPPIVALVSTMLMRERLSIRTLLAMIGALGGTILLVAARTRPDVGNVSLLGVCFALLSAAGYAGFILCGRQLTSTYHPLHVNAVAFGTGALLLLCCAVPTQLVVSYPFWGWMLLLYLGCVPTALAYGLFQVGMKSLSATLVSIVTLFEPFTAAVLAWIFFHEQLNTPGLLGAALLLVALLIVLLTPQK